MYLRANADFFFCVLVVFPSFCTSWRSLCRLEEDEPSLFVASQTHSIRDFLTPKLNKVSRLLFILKFKSVGLLNFKKSRHSGFETSTYTLQCELAKKQYSVLLDLRTGYRLPWSSISVETFPIYFLADWSLTFATQMLLRSVLRTGYPAHCCNPLADNPEC